MIRCCFCPILLFGDWPLCTMPAQFVKTENFPTQPVKACHNGINVRPPKALQEHKSHVHGLSHCYLQIHVHGSRSRLSTSTKLNKLGSGHSRLQTAVQVPDSPEARHQTRMFCLFLRVAKLLLVPAEDFACVMPGATSNRLCTRICIHLKSADPTGL